MFDIRYTGKYFQKKACDHRILDIKHKREGLFILTTNEFIISDDYGNVKHILRDTNVSHIGNISFFNNLDLMAKTTKDSLCVFDDRNTFQIKKSFDGVECLKDGKIICYSSNGTISELRIL